MESSTKRTLSWAARMLAQSVGVNVIEDPHATAFAMSRDGKFICPAYNESNPHFEQLVNGGLVHEIGHFLHSDFAVLDGLTPVEKTFTNIFEDVFVERTAQARWKGAAAELEGMWSAFYALDLVSRPDAQVEDVLQAVGVWTLAECRARAVGIPEALGDAQVGRQLVLAKFGQEVVDHVDDVLIELDAIANSNDSLRLARKLLSKLVDPSCIQSAKVDIKQSPERSEGQPQEAEGQAGGSGDQDGAEQQPGGDQAVGSQPGESNQSKSDLQEPASDDGQPQSTAEPVEDSEATEDGDSVQGGAAGTEMQIDVADFVPFASDAGDIAKEALEQFAKDKRAGGPAEVQLATVEAERLGSGAALIEAVHAQSMGIRERIRHKLLAATRENRLIGKTGRIMPTQLWKLKTGNANVFERVIDGVSMSTVIHFLVDASYSMRESNRIGTALKAAAAVTLAVEGIPQVKSAITAFPCGEFACVKLKKASETTQQAGNRIAGQRADGGTPLAKALHVMRSDLVNNGSDRTILMIATDGDPDDDVAAMAAVRQLEALGVEVVVICIKVAPKGLAQHEFRVNSVDDLATALFGYLEASFDKVLSKAA